MKMAQISPNGLKTLWEKGEIARYEQFLLFPQWFQKTCTADTKKTRACLGKGLKYGSYCEDQNLLLF